MSYFHTFCCVTKDKLWVIFEIKLLKWGQSNPIESLKRYLISQKASDVQMFIDSFNASLSLQKSISSLTLASMTAGTKFEFHLNVCKNIRAESLFKRFSSLNLFKCGLACFLDGRVHHISISMEVDAPCLILLTMSSWRRRLGGVRGLLRE